MTQSQVFPSASSILSWAGASQTHRLDNDVIYVCKDGVWNYFGKYPEGYKLICTYSKDLEEKE